MTEMTEQPITEMADIPNREWYVDYEDGAGKLRRRFFGNDAPESFKVMIEFCKQVNGQYVGLMSDPDEFGPWGAPIDGAKLGDGIPF